MTCHLSPARLNVLFKNIRFKKYKNTWRQIVIITWARQGKNRHRDKWLVNHQHVHKWREMCAAIKKQHKDKHWAVQTQKVAMSGDYLCHSFNSRWAHTHTDI